MALVYKCDLCTVNDAYPLHFPIFNEVDNAGDSDQVMSHIDICRSCAYDVFVELINKYGYKDNYEINDYVYKILTQCLETKKKEEKLRK